MDAIPANGRLRVYRRRERIAPANEVLRMTPIYVNRALADDDRRSRIFNGGIFVYSAPAASKALIDWGRELIDGAFKSTGDIRRAHLHLAVDKFVELAGPAKSTFTNSDRTKKICQELVVAMGCDPELTYFDLPRMRIAPPGEYLTAGVSYAYKPHRDTWYAHPRQLVNYWSPMFDAETGHVMPMYVQYFGKSLPNESEHWDYDDWVNNSRYAAASNVKAETRKHPLPSTELGETLDLRIVPSAGDLMLFSTCQLHASPRNDTDMIRYSYDLRTLNIDDIRLGRGPANVDAKATGSTLRDFLRVSDLAPLEPAKLALAS
jgi:hypothetical protein